MKLLSVSFDQQYDFSQNIYFSSSTQRIIWLCQNCLFSTWCREAGVCSYAGRKLVDPVHDAIQATTTFRLTANTTLHTALITVIH